VRKKPASLTTMSKRGTKYFTR